MKQKTSLAKISWPTSPSASCGHWFTRSQVSLQPRVRLCVISIMPMLPYNIHICGLTKPKLHCLDIYSRRHLRQIINIYRISDEALKQRCPPAQRVIANYFANANNFTNGIERRRQKHRPGTGIMARGSRRNIAT